MPYVDEANQSVDRTGNRLAFLVVTEPVIFRAFQAES